MVDRIVPHLVSAVLMANNKGTQFVITKDLSQWRPIDTVPRFGHEDSEDRGSVISLIPHEVPARRFLDDGWRVQTSLVQRTVESPHEHDVFVLVPNPSIGGGRIVDLPVVRTESTIPHLEPPGRIAYDEGFLNMIVVGSRPEVKDRVLLIPGHSIRRHCEVDTGMSTIAVGVIHPVLIADPDHVRGVQPPPRGTHPKDDPLLRPVSHDR